MFATAVSVVVTLVIGGITRLTESGLSITEWEPVSGALPPLTAEAWAEAFQKYLLIPEAQTVHKGITLESFKQLFWWEWIHRNVARIVGLVIALPWLVLLVRRRIPGHLSLRLAMLPVLVVAQGALGWYMVSSGLSARTDVSQYRLVAHLGLAIVIFVIAVWTWLTVGASAKPQQPRDRGGVAVAVLTFITILSGGFVAGLDAGHVYNTFPLMGGQLVPLGYSQLEPWWRNWFENAAAVQFNHRVLAMVTATVALTLSARRLRTSGLRGPWLEVVTATGVQIMLGLVTLLLAVPIPAAVLHQLGSVVLLTAALRAAALPSLASYASASASRSGAPPSTSATTRDTKLAAYPRRARKA